MPTAAPGWRYAVWTPRVTRSFSASGGGLSAGGAARTSVSLRAATPVPSRAAGSAGAPATGRSGPHARHADRASAEGQLPPAAVHRPRRASGPPGQRPSDATSRRFPAMTLALVLPFLVPLPPPGRCRSPTLQISSVTLVPRAPVAHDYVVTWTRTPPARSEPAIIQAAAPHRLRAEPRFPAWT